MATRMLQRRATAAEWAAQNPVLSVGEIGFATDSKVIKLGDGTTPWNDLQMPYLHRSGGTMTGPLSVQEPTQAAHAARLHDLNQLPYLNKQGDSMQGPLYVTEPTHATSPARHGTVQALQAQVDQLPEAALVRLNQNVIQFQAASMFLFNLPTDFSAFRVVIETRTTAGSGALSDLHMRVRNDNTIARYRYGLTYSDGDLNVGAVHNTANNLWLIGYAPGTSATEQRYGLTEVIISTPSRPGRKAMTSQSYSPMGNYQRVSHGGGEYGNSDTIGSVDRIDIFAMGTEFRQGSKMTVYGMR